MHLLRAKTVDRFRKSCRSMQYVMPFEKTDSPAELAARKADHLLVQSTELLGECVGFWEKPWTRAGRLTVTNI